MLFIILILLNTFCNAADAQKSAPVEIVLTFDDFPMNTTELLEKQERVRMYIDKLAQMNVQAVFFCIGEQAERDIGPDCLQLASQNHLLANHSFRHPHLSKLTLSEFKAEVLKTDTLLANYPNFMKWFRFPYLDYGDRSTLGGTDRKRVAAFLFLRQSGYEHGYITISTMDWYVNAQLIKAVKEGRKVNWEHLRAAYMSLLNEWLEASHNLWSSVFRKKFVHVLLLHQNDLNAYFLCDIVGLIKDKEWMLVSPNRAYEEPMLYLSKFINSKKGLFRPRKYIHTNCLSTEHIEQVLLAHRAFETL